MEVSIFGPGKGEAIAVHLGNGDWLTVDSCRDVGTGEHPVLRYFEAVGVDVATQLKMVVATHAHDDHMNGIGELFSAAKAATFVSSNAVHSRELYALVETDAEISRQTGVAVRSEFRSVLQEVKSRGRSTTGLKPLIHAIEQLSLWSRASTKDISGAQVLALSPSHESVTNAWDYIAEGTARAGQLKRLSAADPNALAIALWVKLGDVAVLLGADLLNGPAGCGWEAVLATHKETGASLYKVPHHGSSTSHHPQVWDQLLLEDVLSLVAPYRAGVKPIPDPQDIERIVSRSSSAYITALPRQPAPTSQVRATRTSLLGVASNVREPDGRSGHVRARWDLAQSKWSVDFFPPARRLIAEP